VVGTGIALVAHTTAEALACLERAEKLFYLVTDPATEAWLRRLNPTAESLEDAYAEGKPRYRSYQDMTARIVNAVRAGRQVCAAFYGHPGVFVNASHAAIRRVRRLGLPARMLPGISADACLFADLGVNPGDVGCQSYEATDFLAYRRRFDSASALILWQAGALGESSVRKGMACRPERLRALTKYLRRYYPARHPVVLYEASQFPICDPLVTRIPLGKLPETPVMAMTTIYIPPRRPRAFSPTVRRWFEE
jgi:precorrin-2 methylase